MKSASAMSLCALSLMALAMPTIAAPVWTAGVGAQGDDSGASTVDADIGWTPVDALSLSFVGGHVNGASNEGDFSATTTAVDLDWQPLRRLGFGVGYDVWNDPSTYDKRSARGALYIGGTRARLGLMAESVRTETTAQLPLRRRTSIDFNGSGYGLDLHLSGDRADFYVSYMTYDYNDSANRLITFLSNPQLTTRPRLDALLNSGLTVAGALLDHSAGAGVDVFVRNARIGFAFTQFREIVSGSDTRTLQTDFEWPLATHWSARLSAGLSDSDATNTSFFGGARILFHST